MRNERVVTLGWLSVTIVCFIAGVSSVAECEASTEWVWANPRPTGNQMMATAHCGGASVAVGGYGEVFSSSDGIHWIQRSSGTTDFLHDVACNENLFVVVGGRGTVLTSVDGVAWNSVDIGVDNYLNGVGWFDQFVLVGTGPVIATSDDGSDWTIRHIEDVNQYLWDVASDGSLLVATGGDWETDDTSLVMSSFDGGLTWTKDTLVSIFGYGWLNDVTWGDGLFVAVHDEGTTFSSDGIGPWTVSDILPEYSLVGVTWDGSQFVAVGSSGVVTTSPDAALWDIRAFVPTGLLYGIEWTGERYFATGYSGVVAASEDTESWGLRLPTDGVTDISFEDVAWNGTTFVACGYSLDPYVGVFATSPNGWDWTAVPVPDIRRPTGVAWGAAVFAAVTRSSNIIKTSLDGVSWVNNSPPGLFSLLDVAWSGANSEFVAVGYSGSILSSPDGATWSERVSGTTNHLVGVDCDDTRCVAVSNSGTVTTSVDNIAWVSLSITSERLYGIAHNSSRFVAVGETGTVLTSTDGVSWEQEDSGTTMPFNDVAWVGDSFVATLVGGGVYSSIDGETWSGGQVAALRTSFNAACNDYPLVVGRNSAIMVRCDTSPDTDGDGAGDLCDPCPSDPDDGCNESESTSSIIGPEGGSVSNAGGSAEVQFPAGVVGEDTAISITSFDPGTADAGFFVGDGLVPAGSVYDFRPELDFTGDVSITLRYEQMAMPECGPEELDLDVYWWDGIDWVPQGAAQDCVANSLTVLTDHFSFYLIGHPDSDGDGIPDARDQCAGSILEDTVVIDGCDSGIDNMIFENGCSVADMVDGCADGAVNHGRFVRCVSHLGNKLNKQGLISGREKGRLTKCAARADIP